MLGDEGDILGENLAPGKATPVLNRRPYHLGHLFQLGFYRQKVYVCYQKH